MVRPVRGFTWIGSSVTMRGLERDGRLVVEEVEGKFMLSMRKREPREGWGAPQVIGAREDSLAASMRSSTEEPSLRDDGVVLERILVLGRSLSALDVCPGVDRGARGGRNPVSRDLKLSSL